MLLWKCQAKNYFTQNLTCYSFIHCTFICFANSSASTEHSPGLTAMTNTTPAGNHGNTSREELIDILSTFQKISLAVPYFIIEPLALVLNFLTLYILWKREKQARRQNAAAHGQPNMARPQLRSYYFLRHLVFSDLLTCFVAIPFDALEIYRLEFRRSREYCAASKYVRFVAISSSFYLLVVINFERFWSVTFPFRPLSRNKIVYLTRWAWLAAFLINIPSLFLYRSQVEYLYDNERYFVKVCLAEKGLLGSFARSYLGVTFIIPAIAIAVFSLITLYRILKIERTTQERTPDNENLQVVLDMKAARRIALSSLYISAGFWLCSSPAGFYYLIIAGTGRPEFPTSYLIGRSIVIIANSSAVVNPLITILCFPQIKESAKRYLGLGTKESYSTTQAKCQVSSECNNVELVTVKIRSSFRRIRHVLQKKEENLEGLEKDSSEPTALEELTVISALP